MLTWQYITQNDYANMNEELKTADKLFFIKDTKNIFCGTDAFKDYVILYNNEPTTNYVGRLYVDAYTLEGKIYDSGNWISVINPVRKYEVNDFISNNDIQYISYDNATKLIVITFIDGTIDTISIDNLIVDLVYSKSVGRFAIDYIYALSTNHNKMVDLEYHIKDIVYNQNSKNIIIHFTNSNISIYIDNYIEDCNNDMIGFVITGSAFVSQCILANNENNIIIENEDMHVICKNNYNTTYTNTEGLSDNSVVNIVDTAVEDIVNTLQASYYEFNFSVGSGNEGEIIVADDAGMPSASGVKIGDETFADPPSENLVATEAAIVDYVTNNTIPVERIVSHTELTTNENDASDIDVVSEKAFIEAIKWRVIDGEALPDDTSVSIDDTLTKRGMAADAKATGDAIKNILNKFDDYDSGKSAYQIAVDNGFEGTEEEWLESLTGKSAYEMAIDNGFEGTEGAWLLSLCGKSGKSAYQIAVDNGFEGTEEEWLESLNGAGSNNIDAGKSAYQIAVDNGFEGDEEEWLESLIGKDGKSAYQIAVDNNFKGTEKEWLESLIGKDGKSAYQIAVDKGFEGTETEWLESLEGTNGKSAYQIAVDKGFEGTETEWLESLKGVSQIINDLITNDPNKPLSAAQGVVLKGLIDTANAHANSAHAPSNAEANQNAYSKVKIGGVTLSANSETATLTLVGNNITITPTTGTGTITISIDKDDVVAALGYTPATSNTGYTHPTTSGNRHIPSGGSSGQILRWSSDGTAAWGADNNTTYDVVSTTAAGLAPKRDGSTTKFLRGDGTWAVPPDNNTTYSVVSTTAAGLAPKRDGSTTKFLRGDGTWAVPSTVTVDTSLSSTSTNPVQNKAVYAAINNVKSKTLTEHLASEAMILSSLQYGSTLPTAGTPGRIFFKKVSN